MPPNIQEGEGEFCVQGFDINQEEMKLLTGSSTAPVNMSDILSGAGGANGSGGARGAAGAHGSGGASGASVVLMVLVVLVEVAILTLLYRNWTQKQ